MNSIDTVGETAQLVTTETNGFARRIICNGNEGGRVFRPFLIENASTNMMLEEAVTVYFMVHIVLSAAHHLASPSIRPEDFSKILIPTYADVNTRVVLMLFS